MGSEGWRWRSEVYGEKRGVQIVNIDHNGRCSPGRMSGSTTVLQLTTRTLREVKYRIAVCPRGRFITRGVRNRFVFSVTHSHTAVRQLGGLRSKNTLIIGSTCNVSGYIHRRVARLLITGRIPRPQDFVVSASRGFAPSIFPY